MRIEIPRSAPDLIALGQAIVAKHTALGAASPLNNIPGIAGLGGSS